ncbi:MAG: ATP phosphoribosyltransferase regulatory subunit [Clostridia bacterium]
MQWKYWQVPKGMQDILPREAKRRRKLENLLSDVFTKWGYEEVETATLEYLDTLTLGSGEGEGLFKLADNNGRLLALRADMTTPIARVIATHMQDADLPLRIFYSDTVYRNKIQHIGGKREFKQAGVELVGIAGIEADVEVVLIALETLKQCTVQDYRLGIGHTVITELLLKEAFSDLAILTEAKEALVKRNIVRLEELLLDSSASLELQTGLKEIATLNGGTELLSLIARISDNAEIKAAVADLELLYSLIISQSKAGTIFFDFTILRDFDYYSGIVFEGYTANLGHPVCGGGRYDKLLGNYGEPQPAVGFAIALDHILATQNMEESNKQKIFLAGTYGPMLFSTALKMRSLGEIVAIDLTGKTYGEALDFVNKQQDMVLKWIEGEG